MVNMAKRDKREKKCKAEGLSAETCHVLIAAIDHLDDEGGRIWRCADVFPRESRRYQMLDKAYSTIQDARDYLRDIIGDVE